MVLSLMLKEEPLIILEAHTTWSAPSDQTYEFNFNVYNNTGSDQDWYITRNKISVSPGWVDGCCWGHSTDPFGGTCFSTGSMDMTSWTMGASAVFTLSDGEYGKLKPQVNPADGVSGSAHYRYFIGKSKWIYCSSRFCGFSC